jgi:nicotinamide phosphoribosyltransferase
MNPETQIDGYKVDHRRQYPKGTQTIVSNFTARGTRREDKNVKIVFFGLQYFIKKYLIKAWDENFFALPVEEVVARFKRRINNYLGPNKVGDQHIRDLHALGYLPIQILALPEGTAHKLRVPSLVIFNTVDEFFWLTNYLETILSTTIWGPCTTATTAHQYKKILKKYALETVGNADFVQWQGHDFSFRGMFGLEAAEMSGAAHLISFTGTDTIPAIDFLEKYYNADCEKELIGGSVAATEHSVACSTILNFVEKVRIENADSENPVIIEDELMNLADIEYVRHLICDLYPTGIVSIVADSFDYWNTITNTSKALKTEILTRDGKVVFRPDTGEPVKVVCGLPYTKIDYSGDSNKPYDYVRAPLPLTSGEIYIDNNNRVYKTINTSSEDGWDITTIEESAEEVKGSIECLWEIFGGTVTEKGYKLLDSHVGLIYGDSITLERAYLICEGLAKKGFASINIVFGIGSFTYQYVTRDTDGYAVKATFARINGQDRPIFKKPKTGDGVKNSAKGLTAVYKDENGEYYLKDNATWEEMMNCELIPIFKDGKILKDWTLQEVRDNLAKFE